uniref:Putative transposase-like protein n=1 Tax=Tabanus bromius TaxID=304241 RepID=A0A0K8TRS1_TABBR
MSTFSNQEYAEMIFLYGLFNGNASAASREYARRYPRRTILTARTISNSYRRLRETGSCARSGGNRRTSGNREADLHQRIVAAVTNDPSISCRDIALRLHTSVNFVWRTLRSERLRPYHYRPVQELLGVDLARRLQFSNWILGHHRDNGLFINNILWTDESQFSRTGVNNFHNLHNWSSENRHLSRVNSHQTRFSVSLWIGVIGNEMVGPFRLPTPLNSRNYLQFLQTEVSEYLDNISLERLRTLVYQHDGAPAHSGAVVRTWLNDNFSDRWIGRNGPIPWPPMSPDLTILDFFVWGAMKELVYSTPVRSLDDLNARIDAVAETIKRKLSQVNIPRVMAKRARLYRQNDGGHFEQLL